MFNEIVGAVLPDVSIDNLQGDASSTAQPPPYPTTRLLFLDAPGGTGKPYVTEAIHQILELRAKHVIPGGKSAVAAQLIRKVRTALSYFNIPITCDDSATCSIYVDSDVETDMRQADFTIWNGVVM